MKNKIKILDKRLSIQSNSMPVICKCGCKVFYHFNSYSQSDCYNCEKCNQSYLVYNLKINQKKEVQMKTRNATNLFTNKTSIKVLRFWAIYDGNSMMIDNDGNQSYIQDWESFEGFGFEYLSNGDYKTDSVSRNDLSELEYEQLLEIANHTDDKI